MAKKNGGTRPTVATLPGNSPSATLGNFLSTASESAKPPSTVGRSTGAPPQNRRK
jgi:hypothetical protein